MLSPTVTELKRHGRTEFTPAQAAAMHRRSLNPSTTKGKS